ncbi:GNAT family acetyltransferase [Flavobacterium sp.]|uniref:GNAT family acetyltransferase n=1 Tax=Flavobacterium sp. TaxID=239 RepID=UPI00286A4D52|nr:GNAT family acetyltransferase [Flavobacterium sp.]
MLKNIFLEIANNSDISGILELQELYLVSNLNDEEKQAGFVTTPFTIDLLKEVIADEGIFIAKSNNKIIGYAFAASWAFFSQWPIFEYMISMFPRYKFRDFEMNTISSFQYGPVCIHKDFRGQGLIKDLFEFMRIHTVKKYPIAVTFINKINIPSTKAHVEKLKWEIIDEFSFNNNDYIVLAYDMKIATE